MEGKLVRARGGRDYVVYLVDKNNLRHWDSR